ncbi:MAG TPA: hypothetical protein VFE24_09685 [Pirellulales bacterium]|nr:hypothetical protein [Pirellulales bacterium]
MSNSPDSHENAAELTPEARDIFDEQVEAALAELPPAIVQLFETAPLIVEDYPDPSSTPPMIILDPLGHRIVSIYDSGIKRILIYRSEILQAAMAAGEADAARALRRQIQEAIYREVGRYHGLSDYHLHRFLKENGF